MNDFTQVMFTVANPSPYERGDYVQVNLADLGVPAECGEDSLALYRQEDETTPLLFQIDELIGSNVNLRVMTFFSDKTPAGDPDYKSQSMHYILKKELRKPLEVESLIDHYYLNPNVILGDSEDGHNIKWDPSRPVKGVKLKNKLIEINFKLTPDHDSGHYCSYSGAATSVTLRDKGPYGQVEMLCPFTFGDSPTKKWGQISQLVFHPLPWEFEWFHKVDLMEQDYELIWSKTGTMRAVVVLKSKPIYIEYNGAPVFSGKKTEEYNLYRVIYVYTYDLHQEPCFVEELFVLTKEENRSIAFRAYYFSNLFPSSFSSKMFRFEHIPDYFSIWKDFDIFHHGYIFASDAHIRGIEINNTEVKWRLQITHHKRCTHYFSYQEGPMPVQNPFDIAGHCAWYEKLYKPLALTNLTGRFPPVLIHPENEE